MAKAKAKRRVGGRPKVEVKVATARDVAEAAGLDGGFVDAELKMIKSQQVRAMAKLSVQKSKAEKQLSTLRSQLKKLDEDKCALFREV